MTPKEKAKELFDKYFEATNNYYQAKQCALIAVDEIIEAVRNAYDEELLGIQILYWEKVKQEIEKL
jgi:hypothetical protein